MTDTVPQKSQKARKIKAYGALSLVLITVMVIGWYYYRQYEKYSSTDDAYIDADWIAVSSKILGRIIEINVEEGDTVKTGQLLVHLDSSDLVAQRIQAMAVRDQAIAAVHQAAAKSELDQKNTDVQEINVEKAKEDLDRATVQYEGNVIAKEQFDHMNKAWQSAKAQLEASRAQLSVGRSQVESAELSIKTASAQIAAIETQLKNNRIYSPGSGRIAKRWLLPGDVVQPGQAVLTLTKDSLFWITAFFEETKLGGIHVNQEAEFTIDAFPGVKFFGSVINIGTNTAAQFSLIPPNNASGNFTKVTQRIPVKISIKSTDSKDPGVMKRFVSGMSAIVKIYK